LQEIHSKILEEIWDLFLVFINIFTNRKIPKHFSVKGDFG